MRIIFVAGKKLMDANSKRGKGYRLFVRKIPNSLEKIFGGREEVLECLWDFRRDDHGWVHIPEFTRCSERLQGRLSSMALEMDVNNKLK